MKYYIRTILTIVLTNSFLFSQQNNTISLTGKVVDLEMDIPLEYATIVLQNTDNPEIITGAITDEKGNFKINIPKGNYTFKAEYISYNSYVLNNLDLNKSKKFGTIKLTMDVSQLDAVEVIGEKTTVEIKLDKKVYNIGKDLTTSGASVTDALNNVPSITVDIDGAISLRGNENVRILINGKPSAIAGFGSTDVLQQLPADAIEKVEVITSPSARYDAEGTAGILNIILKKEKTLGLNGSLNLTTGYPIDGRINTNLNLRTNKFNIFTTLGYFYKEPPGYGFFDNEYFSNSTFSRIIEERDIFREDNGFNINFGLEYYLTKNSSLTGSFFTRLADEIDDTRNDSKRFIGETIDNKTLRRELENEDDKTYQLSLNYTNNFNDDGHKLTTDFQYSFDNEIIEATINESSYFPTQNLVQLEQVFETEKETEYLFQVDYVLPIKNAQFEAGLRGNFEENTNDYRLDIFNETTNEFETNVNLTNNFKYNEDVTALYAQYGNKYNKLSFLLGLRAENTNLKGQVTSILSEEELIDTLGFVFDPNFERNFFGFFPTINLNYELGEDENVSLGYNRRINRPRGWFINPFPSRSSRTNIFQGNPDLNPSYADAFELGYLKKWDILTFTSSIYYQRETNAFELIRTETGQITSDGINIIRLIPINLATNQRYGGELSVIYRAIKWLRFNGSFNFFKFNSEGSYNNIDYGSENTSWFSRVSTKVTLPSKIEWQTNAFYRGPRENSQTKMESIFSLDMALSKDILDDNATISFNVRDLFNTRKRNSFTESFNEFDELTFTADSEFQWRERQFTVSLIYRFNQSKEERNNHKFKTNNENQM